ncbi:hypothetical protein QYE76_037099 [Lolium multiflorum]|uniref:Uncharacterized protein n=1 Tax=Lolium multiflorum TaxID=4521 RepID=A0AAD8R347_LOLMU|nr:hypothetical protein QYE76_037099 [Lolium multiflorum]
MIREEPKPRSLNLKLPGNLKHYDGSERPDTWIEDYYNAVTFAGGTPNIACRMLQLYLIGPARVWLSDLEENTIFCWLDLKKAFENHFRGTYKRPATTSDLQACIQKKGETSRSFPHPMRGGLLRHKLTCLVNANKLTLDEMINIASDHTAADDDAGGDLAATAIPLHQQKKNRDNGVSNSNKRKNPPEDQKGGGSDMVAMTFQRGGPGGGRGRGRGGGAGRGQQRADEVTAAGSRAPQTYEEYRDMPCLAHLDPATGKSTHTNRNCKWVNDLKNDPEAGYKRARKHRPAAKEARARTRTKRRTVPKPWMRMTLRRNPRRVPQLTSQPLWSDHPAVIPKECYALVVSPRIDGYDFSKCLMDGGASLNIMYLETLEKMNLTKEQLKHSTTEFHGVVPGKKANSLGSIKLPVAFGNVNNYREEMITFEVVPFKSSYHVIFGRPTYHKFHARACYIYNKLKIPGPNGWITVSGDYKKARDCEEGEAAFAESVISGEELQGYRAAVDPTEMQTTKKQISEQKTSFKAAIETKKHDLIEGATYQRTMQRCLKDQIGRNVHAYVDDIAVMTRKGSDLLSDLKETFDNLRRYKMMLNPLKCVFGVPAGKLLGFIVSHRGIEVNPEKIKAILNIKRPTCLKDVQRLTGCVAAISRFVSRLGEKALPLYKLLKKTDKFVWDEAADKALQELKNILSSPPILAAPAESEPMLLYIAATNKVISLVIVVVRKEEGFEHGVQRPVYYISEVLTESKQRYPHFQKLAYGVFLGSRKLRHYFQEHPMTVVSKAPLATIINNSDATGRVAKWGIELSAFDINYEARTAIKSQVLADFIADWTEAPEGTPVPEPEAWIHFDATNNMAEYEALLHGLRIAKEIGIKHIICCGDSDLVAQQVAGTWNARNSVMAAYRDEVDEIAKCFLGYEVKKRTPDDAEELLAKIGRNHDDWSTPEPTPTPIVKKRGMIKLNDEDMREAKKSLKEKGIKPEDVKNLPPIEDICETIPPSSMIEYMKDIVTNKRKIPNEEISTMLANYSFNGKIPKKLGDPGAVIDCNKGMVTFNVDDKEHTVYFPKRIDKKGKMKKFKFGELFKKATTSTGRPSRASTQIRRSYNEDVIAPSFAPEEDHGAPNASSFPCYEFLTNAGILDDFFTLVNRAGLATYVGDERGQYYRLTKVFVESFKFHNTEYEPTVAFKIYDIPVTMKLEEFCCALGIAPVGTARRIDDNPRDLLELYRGITGDDCRTIQRGKIRNIQLPAIKYFAYYIGTSILGRENTSNISSYHLAFLNVALTGETPYHLGSLIARRLSSRGPIFGGTIALRILTHLDIPLDSNDVPLTPRKLDIAAMKSHRFVTTDSTIDNMVYRMLFADGNEKEIPLPQQGLFNIDRQSWSLTKEVVEEHMKIQEFHQQHDSENAEPSYDYTVTYPDVSSSTYMEPGRSSSYYEDTTSWGPWE